MSSFDVSLTKHVTIYYKHILCKATISSNKLSSLFYHFVTKGNNTGITLDISFTLFNAAKSRY